MFSQRTIVKQTILLLCVLISTGVTRAWADSPLTYTDFWRDYAEVKMVKYAREKRVMDKTIAAFLMDAHNGIGEKAAVCNALGWDIKGSSNGVLFEKFLRKKYRLKGTADGQQRYSADEAACLGYLKAMDNYFYPEQSLDLLKQAQQMRPASFTIRMLLALVKAQIAMETDWCEVYRVVEAVDSDTNLEADMNAGARKTIMDYIMNYRDYCK